MRLCVIFCRHVDCAVLAATGFITCSFPIINAFVPKFEVVLLIAALNGVIGGLAAGSNAALLANCLPVHPVTGQVLNAARDSMLIGAMTMVTGAVVPTILGHTFVLFATKVAAYRSFFLAAACIHAGSVCLLLCIDVEGTRSKASLHTGRNATGVNQAVAMTQPLLSARVPAGANLCDRLWLHKG